MFNIFYEIFEIFVITRYFQVYTLHCGCEGSHLLENNPSWSNQLPSVESQLFIVKGNHDCMLACGKVVNYFVYPFDKDYFCLS